MKINVWRWFLKLFIFAGISSAFITFFICMCIYGAICSGQEFLADKFTVAVDTIVKFTSNPIYSLFNGFHVTTK